MKELIRHILKESDAKNDILNLIKDEDIFVAAKFVGGLDNLKRILKDEPEYVILIDSLKGKLNLIYHSRKEYIEFPMRFEIVGKGVNIAKTNSWPIVNLIYDDSKLSESEKKLFEQVVYDAIGDLTIDIVDIKPEAKKMFRERGDYMDYKYVNGRYWETLDHGIQPEDNDMRNLHREYYTKSYMNESKTLQENEEDNKVKLAKSLIYDLFDEVKSIEQSTFDNKPLLNIYYTTDSKAANHSSWLAERIIEGVMEYTGNNLILAPWWKFDWDVRKKLADIYIGCEELKTDKNGNELNEIELTEKCWKGYTQKGMKTMFGKRYPNCVKIKKKKTMKESIRNILLQEVNKKYSKPTEKVDKLVYNWLDNYFEGSQVYKYEGWKYYSFRFEFCNNGRGIADLHVRFDDKSPDFGPRDKRPTNERSVEEVNLYIYPDMIKELLADIPIRKNYLLYLIEEWFEDTQLDKVQQEFNRNDLSLDYLTMSVKKRGDICVPPVSKPEGVTKQEMMDLIKKTTLYSYKDIEKHEEEEPGWIEELYLAKLWGKEQERVNQEDGENDFDYDDDDY